MRAGRSLRAIARELGRSPATVSREVGRNSHPRTGKYNPFYAQQRAAVRRARSRDGKIRRDPELKAYIQPRLNQRWSPEQISRALREVEGIADQRSRPGVRYVTRSCAAWRTQRTTSRVRSVRARETAAGYQRPNASLVFSRCEGATPRMTS
uniref:helix-turn-helix domain-containing protein n=1 Tax=Catenulispora acidiphila TaxID=304895 RepID=UPI001CBF0C5C